MTTGLSEQVVGYVGVPPSQMRPGSRFPLQVRARITGLSGFPLQSLTRTLLLLSICLMGCDQSKPFEKDGWRKKLDWDYLHRDEMVQDLMNNHKLVGRTTREVRDLLGAADQTELGEKPHSMSYQVVMDFGWDIDPVHTKYLVLEFGEDSIVTKAELLEWMK